MRKHTKIYFDYFGYGIDDVIICEFCGKNKAVDIHHIDNKGMGGSKTKDKIENLIALCRDCHDKAHKEIISKQELVTKHYLNILP